MTERKPYKPTLFDRHGAAAADYVRAYGYGAMVMGLVFGVAMPFAGPSIGLLLASVAAGLVTTWFALGITGAVGWTWKRLMMDGASTPYIEQYSYQQALVMKGQLDEALESFEAVIAEQ